MTSVCVSSKKYEDLIPGFLFLWNLYADLPIRIVMTGERNQWCSDLFSFLQTLNDDSILVLLEDYWLRAPTDYGHLQRLQNEVEHGAHKADLQGQVSFWPHDIEPNGMLLAKPSAQYRTSLQASIWQRDYLLRKLRNGTDPWSFELQDCAWDGARIVGMNTPTLFYTNIMFKGAVADYEVNQIKEDDWRDMVNAGVVPERVRKFRSNPCK